jgi:hypothetical protein
VLAVGNSNFYFDYNYNSKNYYNFETYRDYNFKFIKANQLEDIMVVKTLVLNSDAEIVFYGSPILDISNKNAFIETINKLNKDVQ